MVNHAKKQGSTFRGEHWIWALHQSTVTFEVYRRFVQ